MQGWKPIFWMCSGVLLGRLSAIIVPQELPWLWVRVVLNLVNATAWILVCIQLLRWIQEDRKEQARLNKEIEDTAKLLRSKIKQDETLN